MRSINRCVAIVRVKQPFLDWLKKLPDPPRGVTLATMNDDCHSYLLPQYEMEEDQDQILADFYDDIFVNELMGWWTDEEAFPKERTLATFRRWFDVEFHSVALDLIDDEPLEHDEAEEEEDGEDEEDRN